MWVPGASSRPSRPLISAKERIVPINGSASDDTSTRDESGVLYCANHPNVQTNLRCSRCGKPICARCRVATPVGYRCYDCADVKVVPTYAVDTSYYVKS